MRYALAIMGVLLMAACSSSGSGGSSGNGTLVTFTRTGGIAALNDTLIVGADGSLTLTDKDGNIRLGTADVKRLDELVHGTEFRALASSYSAKGADLMTYTVAVPGVGKVTTMDAVAQPEVLTRTLEECNRLLGEVR